jgi:hypothetical protein
MAEIMLPVRTQLPNTVGGVKAPYALADQSGMKNFGGALERTAGGALDRIINTRADIEFHDFKDQAKAAQIEFEDYVQNNPAATKEQLTAQQNKLFETLDAGLSKLSTPKAKREARAIIGNNRAAITQLTTGIIERVVKEQNFKKFNLYREKYIREGDRESLVDLYGTAMQFWDEETTVLRYEEDFFALQNGASLRQQQETNRDFLFDKLNQGEIPTYEEIENTALSEQEKQKFWEDSLNLAEAQKTQRFETTQPETELEFLQKIDLGKPVSVSDIYSRVGKGLSVQDAKELVNRLEQKTAKKGNDPTERLLVQQYLKDLEGLSRDFFFASGVDEKSKPIDKEDLTEEQRLYSIRTFTAIHRELTDYIKQNPQSSDEQITQKYQSLIKPSATEQALKGWNWWEVGSQDRQEIRNRLYWQGLIDKQPDIVKTENVLNELGLEDSRFVTLNPAAEPNDLSEFQMTVAAIDDEAEAKQYYEKWLSKFQGVK